MSKSLSYTALTKKLYTKKIVAAFCIWICFTNHSDARIPAAVVSAHHLATAAGYAVLDQGGNAFDAAVAVSAALAVVEPYASGLGGGGFWLLHDVRSNREIMIDGRETAPGESSKTMYLDDKGRPIAGKSLNGPIAAGIPGTPAALAFLSRKYGQLDIGKNLAPAIRIARDGFNIDQRFARTLYQHRNKLAQYPDTARVFLPGGKPPVAGQLLRQPQLANTLSAIAQSGHSGFYAGSVAKELTRAVRRSGGIWRKQDLKNYQIIERVPVQFKYRNTLITTASLPSAGGLTLIQALNMLECLSFDKNHYGNHTHIIVEVLRLSYQSRVELLGDSDFAQVPIKRLMSQAFACQQAALIDLERAGRSVPKHSVANEGGETTHFSIIDEAGNRVSATMSINTFFGSGFVAGSTGVLLNNEMDDFAMGEHVPNIFGLYGARANTIAPGKRPLSSMSPTFVEDDNGILIFGTPGGSRIISMILQVILDYVNYDQNDPQRMVSMPRFHHQFLPDFIQIEPDTFDSEWVESLQSMGHKVRVMQRKWGNMQLIFHDKEKQQSHVAQDPRGQLNTRY